MFLKQLRHPVRITMERRSNPFSGCALFVKYLLVRFIRHFQLLREIQFNLDFERMRLPDDPNSIFRRDYDPSESDSPAYSFAITRITHISNLAVLAFDFLLTDTF